MLMVVLRNQSTSWDQAVPALGAQARRADGFTLIELLVAMGIAFTVLAGSAFAYMQAYRITDSAVLQAAGHRLAVDRLEMVRSAAWQHYGSQRINRLPAYVGTLQMALLAPSVTSSQIVADVVTQVTMLTNVPPPLALINVQCIWTGPNGFVYTNEVSTVKAPD